MNRNLDGIYFRVFRDSGFCNVCFSDLTDAEQTKVLARFDKAALRRMCKLLCERIREIGDELGLNATFAPETATEQGKLEEICRKEREVSNDDI